MNIAEALRRVRGYFSQGFRVGLLVSGYVVLKRMGVARPDGLLGRRVVCFRCSHGYTFCAYLADHWRFTRPIHFEPRVTEIVDSLAPGDVFIDVGAHIGIHSVHAAKRGARVYAIEPVESNVRLLNINIDRNNVRDRVKVVAAAACERDDREATILLGEGSGSHRVVTPDARGSGRERTVRVPCITLDRLALQEGLKRVSLVKIDVEGYEVNVLKGARRLLENHAIESIVVEVSASTFNQLKELLESFGYRYVDRLESYGSRWNTLFTSAR